VFNNLFIFLIAVNLGVPPRRNIVSIEGPIGAGKSALMDNMERSGLPLFHNVVFKPERLLEWQHVETLTGPVDLLAAFYGDPRKYGFPFQQKVMLSLAKREFECPADKTVSMIMERSLDTAMNVFSQVMMGEGWLSPTQLAILRETGEFFRERTPLVPTGVVYVDVEVEESLRRIRRRGRYGEQHITEDYLEKMKREEDKWFKANGDRIPFLIWLDGNDSEEAVFAELMGYAHSLNSALRDPGAL
jgi:deoxyadenosine/deoxycytidine kinase